MPWLIARCYPFEKYPVLNLSLFPNTLYILKLHAYIQQLFPVGCRIGLGMHDFTSEKHKLTLTCYKNFVHAFLNKGMINSNPTEIGRVSLAGSSEILFQHEKRNFISPSGHAICSIYFIPLKYLTISLIK